MKDFENVMKAFVTVEPYAGHWFEDEYGTCHNFDWEDNWVVLYSDYKDLLDAYKELLWMREELEK